MPGGLAGGYVLQRHVLIGSLLSLTCKRESWCLDLARGAACKDMGRPVAWTDGETRDSKCWWRGSPRGEGISPCRSSKVMLQSSLKFFALL